MRDFSNHPIQMLKELIKNINYPNDLTYFHFNKYEIAPSGKQFNAKHTTFKIQADGISEEWLEEELNTLKPNEELALLSIVEINQNVKSLWPELVRLHIPILDLDNSSTFKVEFCEEMEKMITGGSSIIKKLEENRCHKYQYSTGQSSHLYWTSLISEHEWIKFMGEMIFPKNFVDIRWLGYALRRGYASLRWSRNTNRNLQIPILMSQEQQKE